MTTKSEQQTQYWWQTLMAVPPDRECKSYERLKRVWFDHTWNGHPLTDTGHENHLTVTLFENMVLFDSSQWLPKLLEVSGLGGRIGAVQNCQWSYEYEAMVGDTTKFKLADVAIHAIDDVGDIIVVIEAKKRGGPLKKNADLPDTDPGSYLDREAFELAERRFILYLVDEEDADSVRNAIHDSQDRHGILTWQALAGLQVDLASALQLDPAVRMFIACAIAYQYRQHEIEPDRIPGAYLADEPAFADIHKNATNKQSTGERRRQLWRCETK